jgi:hypothetical protein
LQILGFFFLNEKKKEIKKIKKKKREKSGWLEPPLAQNMGWPDHPIFGQGVAGHPRPLGVVRPPRKAKKKKMGLGFWGWPDHPQGPGGGFGHHLPVVGGGRSHSQALGGGPATPKIPNPFFSFIFFFWPFGVAGPPPKAWGGFGHPYTANMGWPATPWPKMGWSGHPIFWARGGSSHPDFSLFLFPSFFHKIKKNIKNPKICKTIPFWAKRRRFRQAQKGVVLEWRV